MSAHELCPSCKPLGKCIFEKGVNLLIKDIPPIEEQTPLIPNAEVTLEATLAHQSITTLRELARSSGCPKVNSVNPDYPGKNNL